MSWQWQKNHSTQQTLPLSSFQSQLQQQQQLLLLQQQQQQRQLLQQQQRQLLQQQQNQLLQQQQRQQLLQQQQQQSRLQQSLFHHEHLQRHLQQPRQQHTSVPPLWSNISFSRIQASGLTQVHHARAELYEEPYPRRVVQQTANNNYRQNSRNQKELKSLVIQNGMCEMYSAEGRKRGYVREVGEPQKRWRSRTPGPGPGGQHPYSRNARSKSVGPEQRFKRYRSRSVGPTSRFSNTNGDNWKMRALNEEDKAIDRPSNLKKLLNSPKQTVIDADIQTKINQTKNVKKPAINPCNENGYGSTQNHRGFCQQIPIKIQKYISPAKDSETMVNGRTKNRKSIHQQPIMQSYVSPVVKNSETSVATKSSMPILKEHCIKTSTELAGVTVITRTVQNVIQGMSPPSQPANMEDKLQIVRRNWKALNLVRDQRNSTASSDSYVTPQTRLLLSRSSTPLSGITRTVLNPTEVKLVAERNHRLRSFRDEEEGTEEETEEREEEMEEMEVETEERAGQTDEREVEAKEIEEKQTENDEENEKLEAEVQNVGYKTRKVIERQAVEHHIEGTVCGGGKGTICDGVDNTEPKKSTSSVPNYEADVPIGRSLLKWTIGLRCKTCHQFFLELEEAQEHCQSIEHYNNYVNRINELRHALNIDPMDGPKALELQTLLEDEPPSDTPPENFLYEWQIE